MREFSDYDSDVLVLHWTREEAISQILSSQNESQSTVPPESSIPDPMESLALMNQIQTHQVDLPKIEVKAEQTPASTIKAKFNPSLEEKQNPLLTGRMKKMLDHEKPKDFDLST